MFFESFVCSARRGQPEKTAAVQRRRLTPDSATPHSQDKKSKFVLKEIKDGTVKG